MSLKTHLAGSVNIYYILTALAIGVCFHVPLQKSLAALSAYRPTNMRSQMISWRGADLLLDCYNANPSSMNAMLDDLQSITDKKLVLVIGGMREMGGSEHREHAALLRKIAKLEPYEAFFIGPEFAPFENQILKKGWFFYTDVATALSETVSYIPPKKSLIFAKGSNGNAVQKFFDIVKIS